MAFQSTQSKVISQSVLVLVKNLSFRFKSITVLSMIRKKALEPKMKSLKVRVKQIKKDMGKIREDQKFIREGQRCVRKRIEEVQCQCDQLRKETEVIMKQSACTQFRLRLMFDILRARDDGNIDKANTLAHFLKIVSNGKWSSNGRNGTDRD